MLISKKFAPITITIETEKEKETFLKMLRNVNPQAWRFSENRDADELKSFAEYLYNYIAN